LSEFTESLRSRFEWFFEAIYKVVSKSKIVNKLINGLNTLVGLLAYFEAKQPYIERLVVFLAHNFPRVRQALADKLQMAFMTYGEDVFDEEKNEEIGDKLLETDWLEMDNNLLEEVKAEWI